MSASDRNTLIIGVGAILLAVLGFYFLLLAPLRAEIADREEERDAREQQLQQLEAEVAELEEVQRQAPELERQLLELSRRVPEQEEIPTLILQVEEIAASSGVTQLLIQSGEVAEPTEEVPEGEGGDYTAIPVTMSFEGTYVELQEFLLRLRNLTRLVTVNEVTYEEVEEVADDEEEGVEIDEDLLQVELVTEVYAQPPGGLDPAPPAPDAPGDVTGGTTTEEEPQEETNGAE
ncbi:MAG: type 4a pilus biogenesis protein PilO [Rubrobacter sp.]|nr:type 4a pilus biogenesis protein PilO [Rubrobacter sp.]